MREWKEQEDKEGEYRYVVIDIFMSVTFICRLYLSFCLSFKRGRRDIGHPMMRIAVNLQVVCDVE